MKRQFILVLSLFLVCIESISSPAGKPSSSAPTVATSTVKDQKDVKKEVIGSSPLKDKIQVSSRLQNALGSKAKSRQGSSNNVDTKHTASSRLSKKSDAASTSKNASRRNERSQTQRQRPPRQQRPPPSSEEDDDMSDPFESGGGRPRRRTGQRPPPPPATMDVVKEKLVDAVSKVAERTSGARRKANKLVRELKASLSSDLEKTLVKATRPDSSPAKRKHVDRVVKAVKLFPAHMAYYPYAMQRMDGPYWTLLTKLWRRMKEEDWRTVYKALYLLHRLARDTSAESSTLLRETLKAARRVTDPSNAPSRYFSVKALGGAPKSHAIPAITLQRKDPAVLAAESARAKALRSYAVHVLTRLQNFSPDWKELEQGRGGIKAKNLADGRQVVLSALACSSLLNDNVEEDGSDVTADCLVLVTKDLLEAWALLQIDLQARLAEGKQADQEELLASCDFFVDNIDEVSRFVRQSHKILSHFGETSPRSLPTEDALDKQTVEDRASAIRKSSQKGSALKTDAEAKSEL